LTALAAYWTHRQGEGGLQADEKAARPFPNRGKRKENARPASFWYLPLVKKNSKRKRSSRGAPQMGDRLAEIIAERARMSLDILQRIALAVAANEKAQRRFRTAMLIRVSRIETMVQMIHGAQIAQTHDCVRSEQMAKHVTAAEEYISQASEKLTLAMVKFIYDETVETGAPRGRKRQWSDWEI
jgi:hypothetical protein